MNFEIGDIVKIKKKHAEDYYNDLNWHFSMYRIGEKISSLDYKESIVCFIATNGVGIVTGFNGDNDPKVSFTNEFAGIVYKYDGIIIRGGLKKVQTRQMQ